MFSNLKIYKVSQAHPLRSKMSGMLHDKGPWHTNAYHEIPPACKREGSNLILSFLIVHRKRKVQIKRIRKIKQTRSPREARLLLIFTLEANFF